MSGLVVRIPNHVTKTMEAVLGMSLARTRVRLSEAPEAIGAQAFAFGDDIYVAPDAYRPDTQRGIELLAHELVHVAQQRRGLTGLASVFSENDLEHQAALFGRIGAAFAVMGRLPSQPLVALPRSGPPAPVIQCLMSDAEFKTATNVWGSRDKVKTVDAALAAFHKLNALPPEQKNYTALLAQVRAIYKACTDYKAERPKSDRIPGVDRLIREAHLESSVLDSLSKWQTAPNALAKFDRIQDARELYRRLQATPEFAGVKGSYWNDIDTLTNKTINDMAGSPDQQAVLLREINDLKDIATKAGLPDIIKNVILECTAAGNCQLLTMRSGMPGAMYNMVGGGANTKYTLKHALNQSMGKNFRLGSLLHELTHISIAETFNFTVIMVAADPSSTDDQLMTLAQQRHAHIGALKSAINADNTIEANLKNEMAGKADYPISLKMQSYLTSFRAQMDPAVHARLLLLMQTRGLKSELVEYDTVINQMMLWCYLYEVNQANDVYRRLRNLAEEAYNYRAEARRSKQRVRQKWDKARLDKGRRMSF